MEKMNKSALATAIAEKTRLTKPQAAAALNAMMDIVTAHVRDGGMVNLSDFGRFQMKIRKGRTRIDADTGMTFEIPDQSVIAFKAPPIKIVAGALASTGTITLTSVIPQAGV